MDTILALQKQLVSTKYFLIYTHFAVRRKWLKFSPRKWKKSLKVQNFELVNSAIWAIFTLCHCENLAAECWSDFPPEKFYFEIFSKTNAVSITFGLRYIHGQSLKEIDFRTRNAVDRFQGDSLLSFIFITLCPNRFISM